MYIYVRGVNSTIFLSEFAAVLTVWYMLFVVVLLLESTYTNNSLNVLTVVLNMIIVISGKLSLSRSEFTYIIETFCM
jgi:sensor histidine kinase YesM